MENLSDSVLKLFPSQLFSFHQLLLFPSLHSSIHSLLTSISDSLSTTGMTLILRLLHVFHSTFAVPKSFQTAFPLTSRIFIARDTNINIYSKKEAAHFKNSQLNLNRPKGDFKMITGLKMDKKESILYLDEHIIQRIILKKFGTKRAGLFFQECTSAVLNYKLSLIMSIIYIIYVVNDSMRLDIENYISYIKSHFIVYPSSGLVLALETVSLSKRLPIINEKMYLVLIFISNKILSYHTYVENKLIFRQKNSGENCFLRPEKKQNHNRSPRNSLLISHLWHSSVLLLCAFSNHWLDHEPIHTTHLLLSISLLFSLSCFYGVFSTLNNPHRFPYKHP
ncbi:hypothetical protein VP01_625g3 [Puccinia sorghi]|uniref:Uncharacterized protein n=1 Tax=Puccinia sorghi TaxID=27349 RepID=A0A0L6UGH8_9BASI|nr:hypothetical protein VP01_625g3 [Puccinia sorghi]